MLVLEGNEEEHICLYAAGSNEIRFFFFYFK